ncbi:unnamed protein product [Rangifer tarandus platyrhynchus]|uniref:Uncharacterized protein n=2 Tax=Rangifer tarandus platyrhynchus TaxID=3082113 RepID=A0ABN8ZH17_RANTA|nr:unnamed protein product [Rangifer tarandus platyrhynchus]
MNVRIKETVLVGVGVRQERRGESQWVWTQQGGKASRSGVCLVTDHGIFPGKVCSGQVVPMDDMSLWSVQRQETVLLSSPTHLDQLETELWFYGTRWYRMSCTSGETVSAFFTSLSTESAQ